jgi:hypothetical protein
MSATPNTQAIQVANLIMSLSQQLLGIYQQMLNADAAWTDNAVATTIAAMGTTALAADGTIGAADGSPNVAHPINLTTYPSLQRAVSSNQIAQAKTIMDGIVNYVGGQAVTTQAGARAILNAVTGG